MDYDAIVLDVMMPRVDGLTVLRTLRSRGDDTPVLLLTARDAIDHRVEGLDAGADDYLVKPLRHGGAAGFAGADPPQGQRPHQCVHPGGVDRGYCRPQRRPGRDAADPCPPGNTPPAGVSDPNKGIILSREQIENNLWNYDYAGGTNVVDVYISYLRKKLDGGHEKKLLHTVRGMGWVLKEDV